MYITERRLSSSLRVGSGKVETYPRPGQLIAFARCRHEARPIEKRDLPSAALDQTGTFQLAGSIGDAWPLNTQHFGKQGLADLQNVVVAAITHHQQPPRQPLLEAVRAVTRYRHQDLFEKSLGIGIHEIVEGGYRLHGAGERRARHLCPGPRDLNEKPHGGTGGTEDGLHRSAALPADRRRLDDGAIRIDRHHRDDTTVGEEYVVERTIRIHQDLLAFAANLFELRHKLLEIGGWQGKQKTIGRPI